MKLIVVGDMHLTSDRPWDQAGKMFMDWFLNKSGFNRPDCHFLQVGDFFEASTMTGQLAYNAVEFFQEMRCYSKIVLSGNHDYKPRWGNALDVLLRVGVNVVTDPSIITLFTPKGDQVNIMALPFLYSQMKETTESYAYEHRNETDIVVGHFADQELFGTELDISFLEEDGLRVKHIILGHDHSPGVGHYIGSIYPTAHNQKGRQHRILSIDLEDPSLPVDVINIPTFLDYVDADFNYPEIPDTSFPIILDVYNAPSVREAESKFSRYRIREVFTNKVDGDSLASDSIATLDVKTLITNYVTGVSCDGVRSKLAAVLKGHLK